MLFIYTNPFPVTYLFFHAWQHPWIRIELCLPIYDVLRNILVSAMLNRILLSSLYLEVYFNWGSLCLMHRARRRLGDYLSRARSFLHSYLPGNPPPRPRLLIWAGKVASSSVIFSVVPFFSLVSHTLFDAQFPLLNPLAELLMSAGIPKDYFYPIQLPPQPPAPVSQQCHSKLASSRKMSSVKIKRKLCSEKERVSDAEDRKEYLCQELPDSSNPYLVQQWSDVPKKNKPIFFHNTTTDRC